MTNIDAFPEARVDPNEQPDCRYTTPETMDMCMRLAEVDAWDLDVAADEECHWAKRWYGIAENGLKQEWRGRVWCNPPYSDIEAWVRKAWHEWNRDESRYRTLQTIAMLLPANRTEQAWWQNYVECERDIEGGDLTVRFLPGRIRYGHPGNVKGVGVGSPPFATCLLLWRHP
jgi:phage N-6-adenine-methyltransferase